MDKRIDAFFTGGGPSLGLWAPRHTLHFCAQSTAGSGLLLSGCPARDSSPQTAAAGRSDFTSDRAGLWQWRDSDRVHHIWGGWHGDYPRIYPAWRPGTCWSNRLCVRVSNQIDAERDALLQETLRLEPVVGHLYRRATADLHLESNGQPVTIPAGDLIDLHVYAINGDESVVGIYACHLSGTSTRIRAGAGGGDGLWRWPPSLPRRLHRHPGKRYLFAAFVCASMVYIWMVCLCLPGVISPRAMNYAIFIGVNLSGRLTFS